jgi:hypothetical protein
MDAMTPPDMLQPDMQAQMTQALVPQPMPVTHDVTIVTTKKLSSAKVMGVPPEEFGIERGARDIKTCNYCFHEVTTRTRSKTWTRIPTAVNPRRGIRWTRVAMLAATP